MDEHPGSFMYEHCDIPAGELLGDWKPRSARPQRRVRVASGVVAALATFAPAVLSLRAARKR